MNLFDDGQAVVLAHRIIICHSEGYRCPYCQPDASWCLGAEWALSVVMLDRIPPRGPDGVGRVTTVARLILTAHWPGPDGRCKPCRLPDCERASLATTWLHDVGERVPGTVEALSTRRPSDAELRRITGIDVPETG